MLVLSFAMLAFWRKNAIIHSINTKNEVIKMIDICFSESAGGNIKWLLRNNQDIDEIQDFLLKVNANNEIKDAFSKPTKKVYPFALWFDQYGINDDTFEQGRMEVLSHYYERPCNAKRKYNMYMKDIDKIIAEAKKGTQIRIWHSQSGFALCGLYFFASVLKDINTDIFIVPLPENKDYLDWSQMYPEIMPLYFRNAHRATKSELHNYTGEWNRLCSENSDLRITINDKVTSVDIDYYDETIYNSANNEPIYLRALVGKAICKVWDYRNNIILDGFICERILELIDKGYFEIVGNYGGEDFQDIYPTYILQKTDND